MENRARAGGLPEGHVSTKQYGFSRAIYATLTSAELSTTVPYSHRPNALADASARQRKLRHPKTLCLDSCSPWSSASSECAQPQKAARWRHEKTAVATDTARTLHCFAAPARPFLRGRKGRAAKNSVLTSGAKQLKGCGAKLTRVCVPTTIEKGSEREIDFKSLSPDAAISHCTSPSVPWSMLAVAVGRVKLK